MRIAVEVEIVLDPIQEPSGQKAGFAVARSSGYGSLGRQKEIITSLIVFCLHFDPASSSSR